MRPFSLCVVVVVIVMVVLVLVGVLLLFVHRSVGSKGNVLENFDSKAAGSIHWQADTRTNCSCNIKQEIVGPSHPQLFLFVFLSFWRCCSWYWYSKGGRVVRIGVGVPCSFLSRFGCGSRSKKHRQYKYIIALFGSEAKPFGPAPSRNTGIYGYFTV